ncbi:MAG TPA: ATP-binding protein [Gemmatimonadaceae bacterium]|nr:ATP-binding protein [Gemmatimonadaceae bacterium]
MTTAGPSPVPVLGAALGGPASLAFAVSGPSHVGEVRRRAHALGVAAGLGETELGTLAVIVTEAATNLARHATDGFILLRLVGTSPAAVEVLALDKGPGIRDLTKAMSDGYSTAGTAGHGLGAIRRMATEYDVYSAAETGTALFARVHASQRSMNGEADPGTSGVVCLPMGTERDCGDAWLIDRTAQRALVVLADGLGHGPDAARAADAAIRTAQQHARHSPARIIEAAHDAMRATRGAALAVAEVVPSEKRLTFAGIGNIAGVIVSQDGTKSLASLNGIAGHEMRTVREFVYPWDGQACLIMHSDGIKSRWQLEAYPGLAARHPALIAGILFRDFTRRRDDATVLAVRMRER